MDPADFKDMKRSWPCPDFGQFNIHSLISVVFGITGMRVDRKNLEFGLWYCVFYFFMGGTQTQGYSQNANVYFLVCLIFVRVCSDTEALEDDDHDDDDNDDDDNEDDGNPGDDEADGDDTEDAANGEEEQAEDEVAVDADQEADLTTQDEEVGAETENEPGEEGDEDMGEEIEEAVQEDENEQKAEL